ncbi:hypothetical protein FB471_5226 [Amycolatopsis cihanbeyliensis]|uniref:Excreted virulence factor EspC (Type VII ESX diderm) n=1 Tax=Amycolatopsis cihanbeyliensis TaxID=1128664 RepID=A0A542DQQ9_AMYCI|nr:hypothetical protein FB471_5226 [Amycolatopsis cihanbeyliensis]
MPDGFSVKEGHLAGFSVLAGELADQTASLMGHVHKEARPDVGFTGVMSWLKTPVDTYAHETAVRLANRVDLFNGMSTELNRAAWMYTGQEESAYQEFNDPTFPGRPTGYKDFPDPVSHSPGEEPALDAPAHEDANIRGLLDEVGGLINSIDDAIAFLTNWSPVSELVEPMSGNWTELTRAGEVLTQTGNGAEVVAGNLATQLGKLDANWSGGAAAAFQDHANKIAQAIELEGPINRLVGHVYTAVAGEVERVAEFMVTTLKTAVDKIAQAAASSWIPGYGWVKIIDAVRAAIHIINEAKALIDSLNTVIEQVQTVVEAAQDPMGFVEGKVEEKMAPIMEKVEQVRTGVSITEDLAALSDADALSEVPEEDYSVGPNPRRPGA